MKTYTFELIIHEGSDDFWDNINKFKSAGCDDVKQLVSNSLTSYGLLFKPNTLRLVKFEDV